MVPNLIQLPKAPLPKAVPVQRLRAPQENIPQTRPERERLRWAVRDYVFANRAAMTPPLVLDEMRTHADAVMRITGAPEQYTDYVGVLINNELWREQLASVPYEKRLLLLPKCLRVEDRCPAPFDEFGLLCKQCGLCTIQDLQEEAEKLGYAVLVAEGSPLVMALIQTGKVDAIVGVSCLSVLERAFPYMEAAAIPGIAIPLLQDDCKDTTVDVEWIWDVLHLTSEDKTRRMDLDGLRQEVDGWFEPANLDTIFGAPAESGTESIAREWLARAGKRWRPFLTVCAYKALQDDPNGEIPYGLKKAAIAVECFHKASLVHDDIEDGDARRYGTDALHIQEGIPVALNVGDLLVGEGYRLLAESGAPPRVIATMIRIAAEGHRTLCLGQGAELSWARDRRPLQTLQVLDIFRKKTAPAFEVALRVGGAFAEASPEIHQALTRYSEALGIAYQVRDDLEDLDAPQAGDDIRSLRPALPLAVAFERAKDDRKALLNRVWGGAVLDEATGAEVRELIRALDAEERCERFLESYKEQAVRSLTELQDAGLKGLLRRVIGKIFSVEIKGWCGEFEARNAAGSEALPQATR